MNSKEENESESDVKLPENADLFPTSDQSTPSSKFPIGCLVKSILKSSDIDENGLGTVIKVIFIDFSLTVRSFDLDHSFISNQSLSPWPLCR